MPPTPAIPPSDRRPAGDVPSPGVVTTRRGPSPALLRLRRGVDMIGVATCLCSAAWLIFSPYGKGPSAASLAVSAAVTLACGITLAIGISTTLRRARRSLLPGGARPGEQAGACPASPLLTVAVAAALGITTYTMVQAGGVDVVSIMVMVASGVVLAAREVLCLITIHRYAEHMHEGQARLSSLVAEATDVIMVCDADLVVQWQSPASARLFGLADADVIGRSLTTLLHPADAPSVWARLGAILAARPASAAAQPDGVPLIESRLRDGFGRWRDTESTVSDQRANPHVRALVLQVRDVTQRKQAERTRYQMAWVDRCTGLANQRRLLHAAGDLQASGHRAGALLLVELEGAHSLNELTTLAGAHRAGDEILIEAARRLLSTIDDRDLAARVSDSGLAVLTDALPISAYALATRLVAVLGEPYDLTDARVHVAVSVGIAELSGEVTVEDTLRRADLARRRAAQLGGGRVESFDESIEAALARRVAIERELPGALGRGELDLVYQPVLELDNHRPVGVEALLRWRHPDLGVVCPGDIIGVAEGLDLIREIGDWVLRRACRQLSLWRLDGRDLWMSVNISPGQLRDAAFVSRVTAALDGYGVPADRLIVELPERVIGADDRLIPRQLAALRSVGVRTAIDNFGVGHAALANLRRLPLDMLKADRALFSRTAAADRVGARTPASVLDAVVEMSRRLGIEVVATGLADAEQVELARAAGARFGQGFRLACPEHAERVEAFLESHRTPRL